jgi:hypothetical protein
MKQCLVAETMDGLVVSESTILNRVEKNGGGGVKLVCKVFLVFEK